MACMLGCIEYDNFILDPEIQYLLLGFIIGIFIQSSIFDTN